MKVAVARHAQRTVPQAALARCRYPKTKRCGMAKLACRHTSDRSSAPRRSNRGLCLANAKPRSCILDKRRSRLRGLTFELSGRRRQDARPGLAKMYRVPPDRAWWPAVDAPLERGVRRHCTALSQLGLRRRASCDDFPAGWGSMPDAQIAELALEGMTLERARHKR